MKILVCIKDVQDPDSPIRIDDTSGWLDIHGSTPFRMNRYDAFAVEEALQIKDIFQDATVDVLSVGPSRSALTIKRALGMGADHGIHILIDDEGYIGPFTIALWIASYVRKRHYSLILTGVMSEDLMQGQVGPMIATLLGVPSATSVIFERLLPEKNRVYVEREMEGGIRDRLELNMPSVLTIQTGMNRPRYPSLSNILRTKRQQLETVEADTLEKTSLRESLVRLTYPEKARSGIVLEGTEQGKAAQLLQILVDRALIQ